MKLTTLSALTLTALAPLSTVVGQIAVPAGGYTENFATTPLNTRWAYIGMPGVSTVGSVENTTNATEVSSRLNLHWASSTAVGGLNASSVTTPIGTGAAINTATAFAAQLPSGAIYTQPTTIGAVMFLAKIIQRH
jgi:hypothetical protein